MAVPRIAATDPQSDYPAIHNAVADAVDARGVTVMHGADAAVVRPDTARSVLWVGTVAPNNAVDGDRYLNASTADDYVRIAGAFQRTNSAAFQPIRESMWLDVDALVPVLGSPVKSSIQSSRAPMWLLPSGSSVAVGVILRRGNGEREIPLHWTTYDIDFVWANATTGTGNVDLRADRHDAAAGASMDGITLGGANVVAAGTQHIVTVTTVDTGRAVPAVDTYRALRARRTPTTGDLPGDIELFGVRLRKAS